MSNRADGSRSSGNKRQTTTLGLEQLESRMLAAFGVLETSLNLLGSSGSLGTTSAVTTSAPTVATPIQLAGGVTEVQSRSIGVTVLGADDGGEANLKYTWRSTSVPSGGRVQFSVNGTNAARNNTLTFTKAGSYTIAVTILDRSGNSTVNTLQFNVAQVLTTFSARNAANAVVTSGSSVTSTGNLRLTVRGFDQFGKVIEQPNITWTTTSAPSEGTATNTVVSGQTNFAFNTAGRFSLRAQSGSAEFNVSVNVSQTLASLSFTTRDGSVVNTTQSTLTSTTNTSVVVRAIDQFGNQMTTTPTLSWSTTRVPAGGSARVVVSAGVATVTFTRAGVYGLQARSGTVFAGFAATVSQTLTSLVTNSGSPANQANDLSLNTTSRSQSLNAVGLDQFGQVMTTRPTVAWSIINSPAADAATLTATGTNARVEVNRPGSYSIRATAGSLTSNVSLNVQRKLARIRVTPGLATVDTGATQLFQASGSDQFGQSMGVAVTWSTSGGSISSTGLLTAPGTTGNYTVTATSGSVTGSASIVVSDLSPTDGIDDPTLSTLITTYYADSSISRVEMIDILRTAGTDGSVNSTEFADFQYLVTGSNFTMPDYVRNLARDVINGNAANATYQGASAGNLAAGSPATLLNNLVNKWFLGTNYPVIVGSGISYRNATGNLFNGSPSRADTRQGQLGDCYFIASLASIADKNPTAVANMFMDNGDGTYTVRFYAGALGLISHSGFVSGGFLSGSGSADYVTVNRQLPTYSNGLLAYSGYKLNATSSGTTLWIALAEKAYAQWNQTTNASRDNTNTYAGIEGGWMDDVNAHVLGYNSYNYSFATTAKNTLIAQLSNNRAVTLGTTASPSGLVGSHAYIITGYNSGTDTFSLHNPWGTSHPSDQSWAQLQANCTWFISVDASSTSPTTAVSTAGTLSQDYKVLWQRQSLLDLKPQTSK